MNLEKVEVMLRVLCFSEKSYWIWNWDHKKVYRKIQAQKGKRFISPKRATHKMRLITFSRHCEKYELNNNEHTSVSFVTNIKLYFLI